MKNNLTLPPFKNEDQERKYWQNMDLSENFSPDDFTDVMFPNLKPTTQAISIRIPNYLLARVKERANALMIPYQSLIKGYIKEGLSR